MEEYKKIIKSYIENCTDEDTIITILLLLQSQED